MSKALAELCREELTDIGLVIGDVEPGKYFEYGETSPRDVARLAMSIVYEDRRGGTENCQMDQMCSDCVGPHIEKLADVIEDGKPLEFMMLAFPCKSPNPDKVLGANPDLAEVVSLTHISSWAERVSSFYEPGAKVIVGADGRTFADLVDVPDPVVTAYVSGIRAIIDSLELPIEYVGIDELDPANAEYGNFDAMRQAIDDRALSIEALKARCKEDPDFTYQLNGIERFLGQDLRHGLPDISKTQMKKIARERAYGIVARGDVLRADLETRYPNAARLSVHPQTTHGGKFGVHITPSRDDWVTPWHAAAIQHPDGSFAMIKSRDAEEQGATVAHFATGQPSHFVAV